MDNNFMELDDYGFSFSEEVNAKIQAVFADDEKQDMRKFAANILIGNENAARLNEHVAEEFELCGFHIKETRYSDRTGSHTTLFGRRDGEPCAYGSSSEKICRSVLMIAAAYGMPSKWNAPVKVRICMDQYGETGKAYCLEVL